MGFLIPDEDGKISFGAYFDHIEEISSSLPVSAYDYARNYEHYGLESHSSLHDAWLERLLIKEGGHGDRNQFRKTKIELCFLGPYHDKRIFLEYDNVRKYQSIVNDASKGHGDLEVHEFGVTSSSKPFHELGFVTDALLYIEFEQFNYREENIS